MANNHGLTGDCVGIYRGRTYSIYFLLISCKNNLFFRFKEENFEVRSCCLYEEDMGAFHVIQANLKIEEIF